MKHIPTTIISGFLGSGKTTFLNAIINEINTRKFAIIENEFGEIGIDQDLIVKTEDNLFEMTNGCICCSLSEDLYKILSKLYKRMNDFDELLIETTGIADPSSVALPFIDPNQYAKIFPLKKIICIVDALLVEKQINEFEEVLKQIIVSDLIIINKTDLVSADYVENLKAILQDINPIAHIFTTDKDKKQIKEILNYERDKNLNILNTQKILNFKINHSSKSELLIIDKKLINYNNDGIMHQTQNKNIAHHTHKHNDIESYTYITKKHIKINLLTTKLLAIVTFNSNAFYRIKGILYDPKNPKKLILQSAGRKILIEEGLPWEEQEEKITKIIFIGKKLEKEKFKSFLDSCLVKE